MRKEIKLKLSHLSFHLVKLEKEQIQSKVPRTKEIKLVRDPTAGLWTGFALGCLGTWLDNRR